MRRQKLKCNTQSIDPSVANEMASVMVLFGKERKYHLQLAKVCLKMSFC